jgi:Transposase
MGTAGSVLRIAWVIHAGVDGATHGRSRPVPSIAAARGLTYLGLDVHRDTISVAVLGPRQEAPTVDRIANDEPSVRRLVARFPDPRRLRACYEAGPTGYELARLLHRMDVRCQVIAPALIPKAPGDRIKTDSRDCRRLARLHRAGELVAIRVPTIAEEAVRDLCRARADMLADRSRARLRLGGFLLRHGRIWRGGSSTWTFAMSGGWRPQPDAPGPRPRRPSSGRPFGRRRSCGSRRVGSSGPRGRRTGRGGRRPRRPRGWPGGRRWPAGRRV